jgi:hypothetical protein
MGKYLLVLAVLGVYIYLYMDMPRDIQAATQYEIVQLHNPLMPLPAAANVMHESSGISMQENAKILLVSSPVRESPLRESRQVK